VMIEEDRNGCLSSYDSSGELASSRTLGLIGWQTLLGQKHLSNHADFALWLFSELEL
jgi:hypothetical protein